MMIFNTWMVKFFTTWMVKFDHLSLKLFLILKSTLNIYKYFFVDSFGTYLEIQPWKFAYTLKATK